MAQLTPGQHIHLVGIGGTGLSAIARVLLGQGYRVSGSDNNANGFTEALARQGAAIYKGHSAQAVEGADAVIVTSAASPNHVEIQAARAAGIPVYKRSDVIASIMRGKTAIAVAGTHGKTTTTAMIAHILIETGRDPSYIIGGTLSTTGQNAGVGAGSAFVIEADEYDNMFHGLRPHIAVVTNVEWDHPDFFPTEGDLIRSFAHFAGLVDEGGVMIACADDSGALMLGETVSSVDKAYYGIDSPFAKLRASDLVAGERGYSFRVSEGDEALGSIHLLIPGRHNVLNALAALKAAMFVGVPFAEAAAALSTFAGTGRRFELRGEVNGVAVIDDYAHHPTAIRAVLEAARARYPDRAIWAVWQPHTYSRTQALWHDYLGAFGDADHVVVTDIYAAREQPRADVTAADLVAALDHPDKYHAPTLDEAAALLLDRVEPPAAIVIMSAGDAPKIGEAYLRAKGL